MQKRPSRTSEIRLAELVAALSIATDLGMGQPMEYVLRSCVLAVRLEAGSSWEAVLSLEPGEQTSLSEEQFDNACRAIADFADIKSPYLLGHSR